MVISLLLNMRFFLAGTLQEKISEFEDVVASMTSEREDFVSQIEMLGQNKEELSSLVRELQGKVDQVSSSVLWFTMIRNHQNAHSSKVNYISLSKIKIKTHQ